MRNISFKNSLIILFIIGSGFLFAFYSPIILHPNQYLFSPNGDGISSYYNSLYHIEHDSSYLNFRGMNYPFGEHITYSVNNPLITNIIKYFNGIFPGLSNYMVGILNFSMIFSFLLTAFFLFLIFNQIQINRIIAILTSIAIMALSPQIFRMEGHLSLAYGFCIPLSIWILIQSFLKDNKLVWLVLLCFNSILWIMVHPYYTGMLSAFLLCFALFQMLIKSNSVSNRFYYGIGIVLVSIIPIILYKIFLNITDTHLCRTTTPWGFLIFTAEPECIFVPHHPPLRDFFYWLFHMNDQNWEGLAYIGMANNILIICILVFIFKRKFKQKLEIGQSAYFQNKFLNTAVLSSIIVMFFSMGLPFAIYPKYIPELFNFLNEFRSPARFAWIFFYVISIFCVWVIDHWLKQSSESKIPIKKLVILVLFIIFPFIEAIPVHIDVGQSISQTPNYLNPKSSSFEIKESLKNLKIEDYQAILPLPFYHSGSENFTKPPTDKIKLISELFSSKSGLPIISSCLARTSIAEAKMLIQVLSPCQYSKPIQDKISSKKPFLLLYSKEELSENENNILKRSQLLSEYKEFVLYKIEYDSLFKMENYVEDSTENFIVKEDYEDFPSLICYNGKGALNGNPDWTEIYIIPCEIVKDRITYEITFWIYNCDLECGQDIANSDVNLFLFYRADSKHERIEITAYANPAYSETINDCWSKTIARYEIATTNRKPFDIIVSLHRNKRLDGIVIIDKFRIKELKSSD